MHIFNEHVVALDGTVTLVPIEVVSVALMVLVQELLLQVTDCEGILRDTLSTTIVLVLQLVLTQVTVWGGI